MHFLTMTKSTLKHLYLCVGNMLMSYLIWVGWVEDYKIILLTEKNIISSAKSIWANYNKLDTPVSILRINSYK